MSATPIWFGPEGRPCFGWLHVPEGATARGGVLLCAPAGYEYVVTHRTLHTLADMLARRGLVAMRFDYDGTGDSAGSYRDPGRVEAWFATMGHAADVLRATGVTKVAAVGIRFGALLAATATTNATSQDGAFDALVLWDPVWSGRVMIRQLRALHQLGVGLDAKVASDDGSIEAAGVYYTAETIEHLTALQFPDISGTTVPTMVLLRHSDPGRASVERIPAHATRAEATGQEELLDRESSISLVPHAALGTVVDWLDTQFGSEAAPVTVPSLPAVARMPGGVTERAVRVGPGALFGIVSEADDGAVAGRPTIVCLNNATDHHIGPNRMWVDWGRAMAKLGFRVARMDLSGIGDSPTRPGQPDDLAYPHTRLKDVAEFSAGIADGSGSVVVGHCSGGRIAIDAAPDVGVQGLVAVNVMMHTPDAGLELITHEDPSPPIVAAAGKWHPYRHHIFIRVPKFVWRALDRVGIAPSVCRPLLLVAAKGIDALVIWGSEEYGLQRTREKSRWALDDLERAPGCRIVLIPGVDHALMRGAGRNDVAAIMTEHIVARFGSGPAQGAVPTDRTDVEVSV